MSRKRGGEAAGIKMQVSKEAFDAGIDSDQEDNGEGKSPEPAADQAFQVPTVKKKAKRPWAANTSSEEGGVKNPFAGAKFGAPSGLSFSAGAFGASSATKPPAGSSTGSLFSDPRATTTTTSTSAAVPEKPEVESSLFASAPAAAPAPRSTVTKPAVSNGGVKDEESHLRTMAALNTSFVQWADGKVREKPDASLLSGVRMYIDYARKIDVADGALPQSSEGKADQTKAAPTPSSLFSSAPAVPSNSGASSLFASTATSSTAPASTGSLFSATSAPASSGSLFSASASSVAPASSGSLFSATAPASTGSLFSGTPAVTGSLFSTGAPVPSGNSLFSGSATTAGSLFSAAPSSSGSLFSGAPSTTGSLFGGAQSSTGSLFSVGNGSSKPAGGGNDDDEEGDGDDGDEPEEDPLGPTKQAQKTVNEDEEVLYEVDPCKIMVFKEQQWSNRGGKGRAVVSKDKKTNKHRVVLRAGTTGTLYFNAPLNSSMLPSLKVVKKSVTLMTVSYSQTGGELKPDNDGKPLMYRFMVSSEDEANRLKAALEKAMKD